MLSCKFSALLSLVNSTYKRYNLQKGYSQRNKVYVS